MTLQPKPSRHQTSQPAFFNQDFVNLLSLISHNLMSCKMREMINYCFMCCHTCQSAPALILPSPPHLPLCLTWASPTISRSCSSPLNWCSYLSCSRWAIFRQNGVCCLLPVPAFSSVLDCWFLILPAPDLETCCSLENLPALCSLP